VLVWAENAQLSKWLEKQCDGLEAGKLGIDEIGWGDDSL
jgi:hypothetical protein